MSNVTVDHPVPLSGDHPLNVELRRIRERTLAAIAWYDNEPETFPEPLACVRGPVERYELLAAEGLGDRGFVVDLGVGAVLFNAGYAEEIRSSVIEAFTERYGFTRESAEDVAGRGLALYVFHELFHINQKFDDHQLAGIIKDAFGPDELSKLDVYADVIAAHCQSFVQQAEAQDRDWERYLDAYASNVTLSYNVLTGAFSKLGDHKKRRALGLVTSRLLIEKLRGVSDDDEFAEIALCPVYTSIAFETGHIIALVSRENAWEILFWAQVEEADRLRALWERTGTAAPEDLLALMMPLCDVAIAGGQRGV